MKIGVFDSGVGGFSVLKSLLKAQLFDEIIYYGDTARVPYGTKDPITIKQFGLEALDFFKPHKIELLIVACNTASALALKEMQAHSKISIVGVIEPSILAIKQQIKDKDAPILVLGTKATIQSNAYDYALKQQGYSNLSHLAASLFVPLIEEGILEGELLETCMHYYFAPLSVLPRAIILGCTHFPLIAKKIESYFMKHFALSPPPLLIHSGDAIVEYLQQQYALKKNLYEFPKVEFFASGDVAWLEKQARKWLKL
ncbi:glutamate racemase [Helicobacter cetorum]|uniref:Glutamate racemase n=1 Tax=Helicobacter cetorum (strain ATCC BAA-540 / CCUG 52418 / MIT 99-5656) TaxID=1163745 RepID=I0ET21_HELCM|nr:glutamate racemase [Helicobacter cetorum]AFI06090.1 glutamate racemase [Helicobacter cetorum MIT 99-5656]